MGWRSKVVWTQGMYLLPHHFQQEARYFERLVDARSRCITPYAWGFHELVLDEGLLALGRIGISRASGVMPDGTPFSLPQLDELPAPIEIAPDVRDEVIYLALPLQREGLDEINFNGHLNDGGPASDNDDAPAKGRNSLARFHAATVALHDNTDADAEPEEIETGALGLRLLRARERTDAFATLGIARVLDRSSAGPVQLDRGYIPPQVVCDATAHLVESVRLLHGNVRRQAHAIAAAMGQLRHGLSEVQDFLMLQLLNRHEPVLHQIVEAPQLHPRALFDRCLMLAGELATFDPAVRRAGAFPPYRHDDLRSCFAPLFAALTALLAGVPQRAAIPLELVAAGNHVRRAVVPDGELRRDATLVLAVGAKIPGEQLRRRFPNVATVGPAGDRFLVRVNNNLGGIPLRALPAVPRELPMHAGFHYFQIERGGELWQQFESIGALALHVADEDTFPGLELELWAIRS